MASGADTAGVLGVNQAGLRKKAQSTNARQGLMTTYKGKEIFEQPQQDHQFGKSD